MQPLRAPKRGYAVAPTRRGKGTKIVAIASGDGPYLSRVLRLPSADLWRLFWPDVSSTNCPNG